MTAGSAAPAPSPSYSGTQHPAPTGPSGGPALPDVQPRKRTHRVIRGKVEQVAIRGYPGRKIHVLALSRAKFSAPRAELEKKLGAAAFRVWMLLMGMRDDKAEVYPGRRWIALHLGMKEEQARRALQRLEAARLTRKVSRRRAYSGTFGFVISKHVRAVEGQVTGGEWFIPEPALKWLRSPRRRRGGKRPGAGRKGASAPRFKVAPHPPFPDSNMPPVSSLSEKSPNPGDPFQGSDPVPGLPARAPEELGPEGTLSLGGPPGPPPFLPALVARGLFPPRPGIGRTGAVMVPPPPRIDPEDGDANRVALLLKATRDALGRKLPPDKLRRFSVSKPGSPAWSMLLRAAAALEEANLPPHAWAAWSLDGIWRDRKPFVPSLAAIWSPARIRRDRGWMRSESGGMTMTHRVWPVPECLDLSARWERAELELMRRRPATDAGVKAIADKHFPPGDPERSWEASLSRAQLAVKRAQEDVLRACQAGWPW